MFRRIRLNPFENRVTFERAKVIQAKEIEGLNPFENRVTFERSLK